MRYVNAFSFRSGASLSEMLNLLNAPGQWRWIERDNDRFGEYISASALPAPDWGVIKIFAEAAHEHYAINIVLESDVPEAQHRFDRALKTIFDQVLPTIGARDIVETQTYE